MKNHGDLARPEDLRDRRHVSIQEMHVKNSSSHDPGLQQGESSACATYRTHDFAFGVLNRSLKHKRD